MMSVEERYLNDLQFHNLVNTMCKFICECQFTPTELRDAAMYAAVKYEMNHVVPIIVSNTNK